LVVGNIAGNDTRRSMLWRRSVCRGDFADEAHAVGPKYAQFPSRRHNFFRVIGSDSIVPTFQASGLSLVVAMPNVLYALAHLADR
jgi:hypothetical protein